MKQEWRRVLYGDADSSGFLFIAAVIPIMAFYCISDAFRYAAKPFRGVVGTKPDNGAVSETCDVDLE